MYHCISRTVNREMLLDAGAKEVLRKQFWQVADFSGVEVITYCVMSNHFHFLIRVPDKERVEVSDEELMRRYRVLYPKQTEHAPADPKVLERKLKEGGREAEAIRNRYLARMHDVSEFMKSLKQRYTIWYNRTRGRVGTLWAERYKSVIVEGRDAALKVTAAYIDLNPVRAGLVEDPKDYRWSGYGEAVGGSARSRHGIIEAVQGLESKRPGWLRAAGEYRRLLFCEVVDEAVEGSGSGQTPSKAWIREIERGGNLPVSEVLRCRVRYFTDGAVLGSKEYVESVFREHREQFGRRRRSGPRKMKGSDWEGLTVLRDLRREVFS